MLAEYPYCCPACHGDLELAVSLVLPATTEAQPPLFSEVMTGALTCLLCGAVYPVENTVPLFLPPEVLEHRRVGKWRYE